jgi:predicted protein tyrosine phosphatase
MGKDRSAKAAEIINQEFSMGFEAKCAGVSEIADVPLTKQAVEWANKIVCMEREHRDILFQRFPDAREKDVEVWNIENDFSFGDAYLEEMIREKWEELKNKNA